MIKKKKNTHDRYIKQNSKPKRKGEKGSKISRPKIDLILAKELYIEYESVIAFKE